MTIRTEAEDILRHVAALPDEAIDLAEAALALASFDRPEVALKPYRQHLSQLARDVAAFTEDDGATDAALEPQVEALGTILADRYGYVGDTVTYDDLQNANLMQVIDRRRGLPVALGILYIHAARAQGWEIHGLSFPGHFQPSSPTTRSTGCSGVASRPFWTRSVADRCARRPICAAC